MSEEEVLSDEELEEQELPEEKRQRLASQKRLLEEQNAVVLKNKHSAARARQVFLNGLGDILTHFMDPLRPVTPQKARGRKVPESGGDVKSPGRRMRKEESEEDKELLQQEGAEEIVTAVRITASPSWILNGKMRDYQIEGLNWMISLYENGVNGVLADEMGLGKTLQTISLLGYMKNVLGLSGPHLIIVPNSTLANWQKEVERWCPSLRSFIFHGDKVRRQELKDTQLVAGEFDVCITSYEMVLREQTALAKFKWRYMVIDEAHRIKNEDSKLSLAVRVIQSNHRLLLTGTPLQNNLHELWALLNFLMPDLFEDSTTFDTWFEKAKSEGGEAAEQSTVQQLHKILKPFLLRRVKADVEKALLPKKEVKVFVGLSAIQKDLYKKMLMKDIEAINGVAGAAGKTRLMNIAMQLRKVCNHPYLFQGIEPTPYVEGEHLVTASGKMVVLDKLLKKLKAIGSRVLIFSQMTRQLDIIEDYLALRGYEFCRLDGSTDQEIREEQIEEFNIAGSSKFVFLLSTRAGGLGINLATADTVILFDSDWNPQMDLQAMDRAHRIGQKKQVMVYRLVTQDTIEQKIVERAEAKLYLDALIIQQGRLVEKHQNASSDELLRMVKFGADTIFQGGNDADYQLTDKDIDDIIALSQKKTDEFSEKLRAADLSLANFSLDGLTNTSSLYEHEGKDFAELQREKNRSLLQTWIAPPKRETKVASYKESHLLNPELTQRQRKPTGPPKRPPHQPLILPFQFYPPRLTDLHDLETKRFLAEYEIKTLEEKLAALTAEEHGADKATEQAIASLNKEIADAQAKLPRSLTEKEEAERDALQKQGFSEWKRDQFNAFMRGMELFGRDAFEDIAAEVGFEVSEIKRYHKVFWDKLKTLPEWEKLAARVKRGEDRRSKQKDLIHLLQSVFTNVRDPFTEINMSSLVGHTLSKDWIPRNDLWLLVNANKVGYGNWQMLKRRVAVAPEFAMDWFMRTRTAEDLRDRVDKLLKNILERSKRSEGVTDAGDSAAKNSVSTTDLSTAAQKKKTQSSSEQKKRSRPGGAASSAVVADTESGSASKSKKAKKVGPKRPKTAYLCYVTARREELKEANSTLSFADASKAIGEGWGKLSPEARKPFEAQAAADAERYQKELAQWKIDHPNEGEQDGQALAHASPTKTNKSKKKTEENAAFPGLPPAPHTAVKFFNKAHKAQIKAANPNANASELRKLVSSAWKECIGGAREPFLKQAADAQRKYLKDMAAWRQKNPALAAKYDDEKKAKKAAAKKPKDKTATVQTTLKGIKRDAEVSQEKKIEVKKPRKKNGM